MRGGSQRAGAKVRELKVFRARATRLAAVVSAVVVATTMFAGVASAAPPNWDMTVTKLPPSVSPGQPAGYQIDIVNNGPSNISQLYLTADIGDTPVYLTTTQGSCAPTGLLCSFGALNDDGTIQVIVAYATPASGSTFNVTFQLNTTGSTFSDVKNRSHGDLLTKPLSTALNNNKNFAGFFNLNSNGGIHNDNNLNGNNKQSTGVKNLPAGMQATVEDGTGTTGTCTASGPVNCNSLFGEWSVVNVNGGNPVPGGFVVTIQFKSGTPTGFLHSYGSPVIQEAIGPCAGGVPPATATEPPYPCFLWNAATATASIYTLHNGSFKGR
jgi:hypothetical protein